MTGKEAVQHIKDVISEYPSDASLSCILNSIEKEIIFDDCEVEEHNNIFYIISKDERDDDTYGHTYIIRKIDDLWYQSYTYKEYPLDDINDIAVYNTKEFPKLHEFPQLHAEFGDDEKIKELLDEISQRISKM